MPRAGTLAPVMRRALAVSLSVLLGVGCGGGGGSVAEPIVGRIPEAVAAVEEFYGAPQEYFEISAGLEEIGISVAVDDATAVERASWSPDGGLTAPTPVGEATGATFTAAAIDLDPDRIFERLHDELDDPTIIDLAVTGGPNDTAIYDATIASTSGGVLLVLLGRSGEILAVQGQ